MKKDLGQRVNMIGAGEVGYATLAPFFQSDGRYAYNRTSMAASCGGNVYRFQSSQRRRIKMEQVIATQT